MMRSECHPWGFFLPEGMKVLLLGSFPPARERWSMDFYYPNIQNDMWRILGLIFYTDKNYFLKSPKQFDIEKAKAFCREKGIGMGDTAQEIIRLKNNASDKFLQVVRAADVETILRGAPSCIAIAVTGQKAMDTLISGFSSDVKEPPVGCSITLEVDGRSVFLYRMPSTSRAYPKPLDEKAAVYGAMFDRLGIL